MTANAAGERFGYDAESHQTEFFAAANSGSVPDATYHYDGEGRRVKKISSTETTVFVYNAGGTLVAEYSTELAEAQQVSYLTQDHLGSPRVITNENGAVVSRRDFTAFGEEAVTAQRTAGLGYEEPEIRKNYTGYEKDAESGLEFAQARYYNPTHGRFTSVDPLTASASIRNPQTFNRYSYVLNSPYKFTDPLGLLPQRSFGGGVCEAQHSSCESDEASSTFADPVPVFNWNDLTADEQRLFNTMSISQCDSDSPCDDDEFAPLTGETAFNHFANSNPRVLAGILNQTAQLESITFEVDGKTRTALSYVTSISYSLLPDRIYVDVDPKLKELISKDRRFSSAPGHEGGFSDSWKDNRHLRAGLQISFNKAGTRADIDTDLWNIAVKTRNPGKKALAIAGHAAEVAHNKRTGTRTNPYEVYNLLIRDINRKIRPSYTLN